MKKAPSTGRVAERLLRSSAGKFGILKKLLISFLILSLLPIIVFGFYTAYKVSHVGETIVEGTVASLDTRTRDILELQAVTIAAELEKFLGQREAEVLTLRQVPRTAEAYLEFYNVHVGEIWIREGTNQKPVSVHKTVPLYKEISFVDRSGNEQIRIDGGKVVPRRDLRSVQDPKNTRYRCESYFTEALNLEDGDIHVSRVTGFFVSKEEQLAGAPNEEVAVEGKKYDGVVRFSTPLYVHGVLAGVVDIALDHRHLMEFTQHLLPIQNASTVFPSYRSGNYAFMFDDEGWIITHPKFWDIRGVDSTGEWVPPYTENSTAEDIATGRIPFNLDKAYFVHQNYPVVLQEVREKKAGSVATINVGGTTKIMAYAPVRYDRGLYAEHGVFGGITVGTALETFHRPANDISALIDDIVVTTQQNFFWIVLLTIMLVWSVSWMISRGMTRPILKLTDGAQQLAEGKLEEAIRIRRSDEIGTLGNAFNNMAGELKKNRQDLLSSMKALEASKNEIEIYAGDLEYQIRIFKSIQKISNILGTTFEMTTVLKMILENCVKAVNYDRAILYLLDDHGRYLECKETCGFTAEQEAAVMKSKYNIDHVDCVETRVFKSGEVIFVEDTDKYAEATAVDRKIRAVAKSKSFVFVPLKIKERIIGILGADKLHTRAPISDLDINSLQILANQASRVIENTLLYQEIIQQRNFVNEILRNMPNGVITTAPDGTVTSINRAACSLLKAQREQVVGEDIRHLFAGNERWIDEIVNGLKARGVYHGFDIEISLGSVPRFLNIDVSLLQNHQGHDGGTIIILQDVTDKKILDDHVERMSRLASLGRLAAGVAHEIRNPLTGISLFLDDLHDRAKDDTETAADAERALVEVERLENLVSELLDYASPQKRSFAKKNPNVLIENTLLFVEKQCRQNRIQLQRKLDPKVPSILLDSEKIRQALLNILLNAIHVMPNGGELLLETRYLTDVKNKEHANGNSAGWVRITVRDTGPGIPARIRDKIFDPFFTTTAGGTGLGLSITHGIVVAHQGTISLEDNPDGGVQFVIDLPASIRTEKVNTEVIL